MSILRGAIFTSVVLYGHTESNPENLISSTNTNSTSSSTLASTTRTSTQLDCTSEGARLNHFESREVMEANGWELIEFVHPTFSGFFGGQRYDWGYNWSTHFWNWSHPVLQTTMRGVDGILRVSVENAQTFAPSNWYAEIRILVGDQEIDRVTAWSDKIVDVPYSTGDMVKIVLEDSAELKLWKVESLCRTSTTTTTTTVHGPDCVTQGTRLSQFESLGSMQAAGWVVNDFRADTRPAYMAFSQIHDEFRFHGQGELYDDRGLTGMNVTMQQSGIVRLDLRNDARYTQCARNVPIPCRNATQFVVALNGQEIDVLRYSEVKSVDIPYTNGDVVQLLTISGYIVIRGVETFCVTTPPASATHVNLALAPRDHYLVI